MKIFYSIVAVLAGYTVIFGSAIAQDLTIADSDFGCMLDMQPVRGFYVDKLIEGKLEDTLAVAQAESSEYPPRFGGAAGAR